MLININTILSITIFLIMISVGSSVTLKDLHKVFRRPKNIIIGLASQILVFPIVAFIIASMLDIRPEYKVGIVILAACPGGAMSNFISYLTRANTALSVGMTSFNSLVTLITIPIYAELSILYFMKDSFNTFPPVTKILIDIILFVIIPVILGAILKHKYPKFTKKISKTLKISTSILLLIVFTYKIFFGSGDSQLTVAIILSLIFPVILLNISGLFIGFYSGRLFNVNYKSSRTLGIEIGLQNTALTLLVTDTVLLNNIIGHPALVYSMFSFVVTLVFSLLLRHFNHKAERDVSIPELRDIESALKK